MLNECNIGRTEIVCLCLALVGCIMAISPIGSVPVVTKLEDCLPRKQNKPAPEDECVAALEPSLSYYDKFKYDTNCTGITCDYRHDCGRATLNTIRGDKFLPYIIDGNPQRYGSWPSFASLIRTKPHQGHIDYWKYGGVIISPSHILTCYKCFLEFRDGFSWGPPKSELSIMVGDHTNVTDRHEKTYKLRKLCKSNKYNIRDHNGMTVYDFAVITIDGTIEFDQFKQPACLPYKPDYDPPANKFIHCYLMGWGHSRQFFKNLTWEEDPTDYLPFEPDVILDMPVVAQPCRRPFRDSDSNMCFKRIDKPGTICHGDAGSPVLCKNPRSNRWTVVGVATTGDEKCSKGSTDWQFMVTKIPTILSTIKRECNI